MTEFKQRMDGEDGKEMEVTVEDKQKFLDSCNHFLVFAIVDGEDTQPVHYIAYENYPTEDDMAHACYELATDETFGLTEVFDSLGMAVFDRETMGKAFPDSLKAMEV